MTDRDLIDRAVEAASRASEPSSWAKVDKWIADDDWNGGAALNLRHALLKQQRAAIIAFCQQMAERAPEAIIRYAGDAFLNQAIAHQAGDLANVNEPLSRMSRAMFEKAAALLSAEGDDTSTR